MLADEGVYLASESSFTRVLRAHRQTTHRGRARTWAAGFVHWYNVDHRHSGIRYVSPAQRHDGHDHAILAARHTLYTNARSLNRNRWSGNRRNWSPVGPVTLNPERDSIISEHLPGNPIQQLAA